jgi:hypothetical protein
MKFIDSRPFANPETAAKKLMEIASGIEPVQDGRIFIELINGPFLYEHKAARPNTAPASSPRLIIWKHESGTCVKKSGADLFA